MAQSPSAPRLKDTRPSNEAERDEGYARSEIED
jgi:hypothetical protein